VQDKQTEGPATVRSSATQVGEADGRWSWVEPSVWTARMLEALDKGVKGGVWFSLIDKVYSQRAMAAAFAKVKANHGSAGVDRQTVEMFEKHREEHLGDLQKRLMAGTYQPQGIKRVWIPKPGKKEKRPLGIPTIKDRTVQTALRNVLEPIFERDFADCSYGFRPGRGCKDALRQVSHRLGEGYFHVVDADIKGFFDTLSHARLMQKLKLKVADSRVLDLVEQYLKQGVIETTGTWHPEKGTPQGAVISPLLSNIYLDEFDWEMQRRGYALVRYADDWVILCKSGEEAQEALQAAEQWMGEASLTLHPEKTRIVDLNQPKAGFDFLGYHFRKEAVYPSWKSKQKLRGKLKPKTKRANGRSMDAIITDLNKSLRGWYEYFKDATRKSLSEIDGWIRGRLRGILRKRRRGKGRGRGRDHQRWPNEYFAKLGLFSLARARDKAIQSCAR